MHSEDAVPEREALVLVLEKKGIPRVLAGQLASEALAAIPPESDAESRHLHILNFQIVSVKVDGRFCVRRRDLENILAMVEADPKIIAALEREGE